MIKPWSSLWVNTHGDDPIVSEKTKINLIFQEEQTVDINEAISTIPNPPTADQISLANQGITEVEDKIAESPAEMTKSPIPAWHFFHSIFLISTVYFSKKKSLNLTKWFILEWIITLNWFRLRLRESLVGFICTFVHLLDGFYHFSIFMK